MPERFVLFIEGGSRAGEQIPLAGDRFTIGRKPGNSLVLQEASVSGNHCELLRTADGWLLRDLGSTNGTFVDGNKITLPTSLKTGASFALGSVPMRIDLGAATAAPAQKSADVDEISLEDPAPAPAAKATKPPADLDFVEDEPATFSAPAAAAPASAPRAADRPKTTDSKVTDSTVNMPAAAASAMATRTAADSLSKDSDTAPMVADAETLERARQAADSQARKGRLLTIGGGLVAVAVLGGAGYLLFMNKESGGPAQKAPPQVAGNLLPASTASLEVESDLENSQKGARWQFRDSSLEPEGANAVGFGFSSRRTASGARAAEAKLDGPSYARATTDFIKINSGKNLKFAVQALAQMSTATVQLVFRMKGENGARIVRSGSPLVANAVFTKLAGEARVPAGCDQVALSVVGIGEAGYVLFDDAELIQTDTEGAAPVVKKEIEFEQDPVDGRIRKIDRDLVHSMGILLGAPGARARWLVAGREGDTWSLFKPASGVAAKVNLTMEAGDTAVVYHYKYEGTGPAAIGWTVPRASAPELIVRGSKSTGRYRGEFTEPACTSLVFGEEMNRLRVTLDPPVAVRSFPDAASFRLEFELPPALNISIQYSFDAEKRRALELEQQAENAHKQNKFGEEIRVRSSIVEEFPFERALVDRNETKRDDQLAKGQKDAAEIERRVADAEFFKIPEAFRDAKRAGEELVAAYAGTAVAERVKVALATVDRSLAEAEAVRGEREALRLQTISVAFDAANAKDLSGYIREYLKKNYPNTKTAQGGEK